MSEQTADEEFLLAVLNSTPVVDGIATDEFANTVQARSWLSAEGGTGSAAELRELLRTRELLQAAVRGDADALSLAPALRGVTLAPDLTEQGVEWQLRVHPDRKLAVRAVLAWSSIAERGPGRLRACANDECRRFLLDRSKASNARWCSMAVCGNRMKARRHHERSRPRVGPDPG